MRDTPTRISGLLKRGQIWWQGRRKQASAVGTTARATHNPYMFLQRFFFTDETSLPAQKIADLQRRACWVGVAIILQFWNETLRVLIQAIESHYTSTVTLLDPASNIIVIALIVGSFLALWMAWSGAHLGPTKDHQDVSKRPSPWQHWVCNICLILAVVGVGACLVSIVGCFLPMQFANDGTVLDTNAAVKLLQGENPYANPNLGNLNLMHDVPSHAEWTTPLRQGRFAGRLEYPTNDELKAALVNGLKTANDQEFETKVSYPALSFISLIPFALLNHFNVLPLYILCHLLLIFAAWKYARPELRPWILLLGFANISAWTATVGETLDMLYICLLTLAWLISHRRGPSIILLGLAIASKQTAWFFIPFYAIMIYWQYGSKEALFRVVAASSIGLAINLPFILWGPGDWLAGVMAPLVDPMFPMGTGLIALNTGHVLPYLPTQAYQILEYTAFGLSLIYYWFCCRRAPEAAMLLAVVFLFFAWRSLPSYFYCSAFPFLMLMLKKPTSDQTSYTQQNPPVDTDHPSPAAASLIDIVPNGSLSSLLNQQIDMHNSSSPAMKQMTYTQPPNWCIMRMSDVLLEHLRRRFSHAVSPFFMCESSLTSTPGYAGGSF